MTIRVLLVDDQKMFVGLLSIMLSRQSDIEVVGGAANGEEALVKVQEHQPDVAVIDIQMPRMNGVDTTRRLRALCPACQVVLLSQHDSMEYIHEGIRDGALSYLLKTDTPEAVIATIRAAARGEARWSQEPFRLLQQSMQQPTSWTSRSDAPKLTNREQDVLQLLGQRVSRRTIAERFSLTETSVKWYVKQIREKLNAKGQDIEAVITMARECGLL